MKLSMTEIRNAKQAYIHGVNKFNTAQDEYMKALQGGGKLRRAAAKVEAETNNLIVLTKKLHEACLNDRELISLVAQEIEEEVSAWYGHRTYPTA
jgi:hypothetical protein